GRAVGLQREDHPRLQLHRMLQRIQPADDRALVQGQAEAVAELKAEGLHLIGKAELRRGRPRPRDLVGGRPRTYERDRGVDPFAGLLVRVALYRSAAADVEGAVVAGPVSVEGLDDVEERLIPGPDQPVGEVVRMRAASLAGDRVD